VKSRTNPGNHLQAAGRRAIYHLHTRRRIAVVGVTSPLASGHGSVVWRGLTTRRGLMMPPSFPPVAKRERRRDWKEIYSVDCSGGFILRESRPDVCLPHGTTQATGPGLAGVDAAARRGTMPGLGTAHRPTIHAPTAIVDGIFPCLTGSSRFKPIYPTNLDAQQQHRMEKSQHSVSSRYFALSPATPTEMP